MESPEDTEDYNEDVRHTLNRVKSPEYRNPWENHLELMKLPIPSIEQFIHNVSTIKYLRIAALAAVLYLTGSRISEIIPFKDINTKQRITAGLQRKHIYGEGKIIRGDIVMPQWIVFVTRVLKIPSSKVKQNPMIAWKKSFTDSTDERYSPLIRVVDKYLDLMKNKSPEATLFPFSVQYADRMMNKLLKMNCHFIRHIRASHLCRYHNFLDVDLRKFFGWISAEMPSRYTSGSEEQLKSKLKNKLDY